MSHALAAARRDLREGAGLWRAWVRFAIGAVRRPYRNSLLGPLWEPLGLLLFVLLLAPLYGYAFGRPIGEFMVYLAAGWTIWQLISGCLLQGGQSLIHAGPMLQQSRLPISLFFFRVLLTEVLEFLLKLALVLLLMAAFGMPMTAAMLLFLPGLALMLVASLGIIVLIGLLCARFPDFYQVLQIAVRLAFFVTPILWDTALLQEPDAAADATGRGAVVVAYIDFNPFYHLLEVVRAPLLGKVPAADTWTFVALLALAVWAVAVPLFVRWRPRVVYWS